MFDMILYSQPNVRYFPLPNKGQFNYANNESKLAHVGEIFGCSIWAISLLKATSDQK